MMTSAEITSRYCSPVASFTEAPTTDANVMSASPNASTMIVADVRLGARRAAFQHGVELLLDGLAEAMTRAGRTA